MMTKNIAIALGLTAGVAIVGGVSLKFLKGRRAKTEEGTKGLKVLVREAMAVKNYNAFLEEIRLEEIPDKVVLPETEVEVISLENDMVLDNVYVTHPSVVGEEVVVTLRPQDIYSADEQVAEPVSVSRMRAVVAPLFWSHYEAGIRRLEVIDLKVEDFADRSKLDYNRGWHKCTLNGLNGIMHVTKQHTTAVVFDGREFHGISTSNNRFNSHDLVPLTHERVKAYLQGH